ncbi:hypothetical protein JCM1841_004334 [Sporobolomyces salmonicolor]
MSSPLASSPGRRDSPDLAESQHSSPRPQSEVGLPDERDQRQRDQDAHLAQSMTLSAQPTRARSGTLLDRDQRPSLPTTISPVDTSMMTPQRAISNSTVHQVHSHSDSRRRGSVSAANATDAMGHLADDLEREDREEQSQREHEELSFYEREAGVGGGGAGSRMMHTPVASAQRSAAAARLYRHHRNLSDSSIDSQGGAYIDHRRQPHSLSIGTTPRSALAAGVRSPEVYGSARRSGLRRFSTEEMGAAARKSPTSPTALDSDPAASGISSRTARGPVYSPRDLDEEAIADEEGGRSPRPVQFLDRHDSRKSYRSTSSRRSRRDDDLEHDQPDHSHAAVFSADMSRPGSQFGKPEDDICFPAHGAAAELDDYMDQHHDGEVGMPGVLPNFPYPFDFTALEDLAVDEREAAGKPIPSARRRPGRGTATVASPPEYGISSATQKSNGHAAFSSGSEGEVPRMSGRQRKLSESVAPGRYRRKLALFEGAGDDLGGAGTSERTADDRPSFRNILDTKTPLLNDKRVGGGYGSGGGAGSGERQAAGPRPYRFSFYSNSLPSTIHARSLAEIPADGQTFEELFVGHKEQHYEDDLRHVHLDQRLAQFHTPPQSGTGSNTPNLGMMGSLNGSKNGAGGGGGGPGAAPSGIATGKGQRPRTAVMRSDVDAEANTWWLDVMCPTDQEMKVLSKVFGIHPLTTEDIQMEETREKIELFRNYYFVCFRSFEQDPYSPTYLEPLNMYIIVFREGTLSNVRRRIKQLKDYINVTSDWISYALIDDITDAFGPLIQNIEYEVDSIDELVLILKEAEQSDMLRRIGTCRKKVMGLLRLMGNKADVVKGLSKRCNENWSVAPKSDIGLYLSDIQDHIMTSTQNLTHYEKILSRSHSNYLAQISIEMTDANNQINDVLSKLTALGTVLIPMNLVTGLWGMNVHVPGQDAESLHWFFGILGCLGAFAVVGAWLTYKVVQRCNNADGCQIDLNISRNDVIRCFATSNFRNGPPPTPASTKRVYDGVGPHAFRSPYIWGDLSLKQFVHPTPDFRPRRC